VLAEKRELPESMIVQFQEDLEDKSLTEIINLLDSNYKPNFLELVQEYGRRLFELPNDIQRAIVGISKAMVRVGLMV
jgi:hypothetical protein